ncbi:hypothetical protein QFZ98_003376 [Paraburkholderia youngii]
MLNVYLLPVDSEDSECSATCGNPGQYSFISSGILEWFRKFFPRRADSPDAKLPNC